VCTGHFAECYTRQRGGLPSVSVIALGKEPRPGHRYRFFAECGGPGTRQRGRLCRVPHTALGKEPDKWTRWWVLCRVLDGRHSAKGNFFAECHLEHSAKMSSPSPHRCDVGFSLPSTPWHSAKSVPSAREKVLGKEAFADVLFVEPSLSSATLGKDFVECFSGFCRVLIGQKGTNIIAMSFVGFRYYRRDCLPVPTHTDSLYALTRRQPMFGGLLVQGQGYTRKCGASQKYIPTLHAHIHRNVLFLVVHARTSQATSTHPTNQTVYAL
jgi:hypothetical protein